ncbi:MAG: hypothetical protein IT357_09725, partial [Gemmatimonadaceae bacterium]|nr:hypothetical protein [Gemmatimonadaceae bacterium]
MPPAPAATPLPPARRAALAAIAQAVVPHAFDDTTRGARLLALVEARIAGLAPHKRRELSAAVALVGSRLASLFAGLPPKPFVQLSAEQQVRV